MSTENRWANTPLFQRPMQACDCGAYRIEYAQCDADCSSHYREGVVTPRQLKANTGRCEVKTSDAAPAVGLPTTAAERKQRPIARGVLDYFPDALAEIAFVSFKANEQHNPGEPMHWAKGKSTDHADCLLRHLIQRGTRDDDGLLHTAKAAWRALALLQTELDKLKETRQ